jgi:hypothetical protein
LIQGALEEATLIGQTQIADTNALNRNAKRFQKIAGTAFFNLEV